MATDRTAGLREAYKRAWQRVLAEQARIADNPKYFRRSARLTEMQQRIASEMDLLDAQARAWIRTEFPKVYGEGALIGAKAMGETWGFSQIDRDTVQHLGRDTFDDLLQATQHVRDSSKSLIRQIVKEELLDQRIAGESPAKARRLIREFLRENGIHSVVYRNGARHSLDDYAEMVLRTKSAVASNTGILNSASSVGARYFEVFDGPECGWETHELGGLALGKIVTKAEAQAHIIAHPRCRRSFGPRPDVRTKAQAAQAKGSVTPDQIAAQVAQDLERATTLERRAATKRRAKIAGRIARPSLVGHAAKLRPPAPPPAPPAPPPLQGMEAVDAMRQDSRQYDIKIGDREAIHTYTSGANYNINAYLRAGKKGRMIDYEEGEDFTDEMNRINVLMDKHPLQRDIITKRGTRHEALTQKFASGQIKVGDEIQVDQGFMSTSPTDPFPGNIQMTIRAPAGTRGIFIEEWSAFEHERELLLGAGSWLRVLKYRYDPISRLLEIDFEVVPRRR